MHLEKEWHASAQIKNAFAFLHLTTWDGEEELMRCKSDFRHFGLTKGLHVTKTLMSQELPLLQMREKARAVILFERRNQ